MIFLLTFGSQTLTKAQFVETDYGTFSELTELFLNNKYTIARTKGHVDSVYYNFRKIEDEFFCIADPGEYLMIQIIEVENFVTLECVSTARTSTSNKFFKIFLYEEDQGGGPEGTLEIFEILNSKVHRLLLVNIPRRLNTIAKLKKDLKSDMSWWFTHSYMFKAK